MRSASAASRLAYAPLPPVDVRPKAIFRRLASDKKTLDGQIHFILPGDIGTVEIATDVTERSVLHAVERVAHSVPRTCRATHRSRIQMTDEVKQPPSREADATALGARVEPSQDQKAAAHAVRQMFSSIAPRYDLLNHVLSLSVDRFWWWRTARRFRPIVRPAPMPPCSTSAAEPAT